MSLYKPTRWTSERYLKWVRSRICIKCFSLESDPHHLKGVGNMSGGGLTAPDILAMPLCRTCHDELHRNPELWPEQWELICRTILDAVNRGILVVK